MVDIKLQQEVDALLARKLLKANHAFKRTFTLPKVEYTQRGKIAGTAHLQKWLIRLNPVLLEENKNDFINEVVPHELAHLIVYRTFGKVRPHGKEWRWVMETVFNRMAKTRHDFKTTSVQGNMFPYRCSCKSHQLTIIRHNKVRRGKANYFCRQCKQPLIYDEKLDGNDQT